MNIQYGGTKKTIEKDRTTALAAIDKNDKVGKKRADAVNELVDAFLADKAINDSTRVNVTAVSTDRALTVNVTLDQETFVHTPPVATDNEQSKPLSKKEENAKQAANAKSVTKKVERINAEDATDGTVGELNRQLAEAKKGK